MKLIIDVLRTPPSFNNPVYKPLPVAVPGVTVYGVPPNACIINFSPVNLFIVS